MKPICFTVENEAGDEVEIKLPSCWSICDRCRGNGTHDNPAFSNGISQEDFDEDPDFREHYFAGRYDVSCDECGGSGKVLVPDEDRMNDAQKAQLELYERQQREIARDRRAEAMTRRMESGNYGY